MLNLAMLSVLNRPHEMRTHVRGAINNGDTREEIQEVLLQVAVYAGVPAAVDSFRVARDALTDIDSSEQQA
jgi:4-carboxymuconolactone decarboxylase